MDHFIHNLETLKFFEFNDGDLLAYSNGKFTSVGPLGRLVRWVKELLCGEGFKDCKASLIIEKVNEFLNEHKNILTPELNRTVATKFNSKFSKKVIKLEEEKVSKATADQFDKVVKKEPLLAAQENSPVKIAGVNEEVVVPPNAPIQSVEKKDNQKKQSPNDLFISFMSGEGKDCKGRSLEEILAFSDDEKEAHHDYVQWIFPTKQPSAFNKNAPILNDDLILAIKNNEKALENQKKAFCSMMKFYGFNYNGSQKKLNESDNFVERKAAWFKDGDHNLLRLTRILECLTLLDLNDERNALFNKLSEMTSEGKILTKAFTFWKSKL